MRAHEWGDPAIVSPRALLADRCAQIYCGEAAGLRDRQGRPFMVGQMGHFHGPAHDPDKHLLAIYYMLEQLVAANLRWPGVVSFCYILDFGEPAGAREIGVLFRIKRDKNLAALNNDYYICVNCNAV